MSNKPRLVDTGAPWMLITVGKENIGRVWQHATTRQWRATIGSYEGPARATAIAAFASAMSGCKELRVPVHRVSSQARHVTTGTTRQRAGSRAIENGLRTDMVRRLDTLIGAALRARE